MGKNSKSILENKTHKFLWDFEIQTDPLIPVGRPDIVIINNHKKKKNKLPYRGFCRENHRKPKKETSTWTSLEN